MYSKQHWLQTDAPVNGQAWIYRTLPANVGDPKTLDIFWYIKLIAFMTNFNPSHATGLFLDP